MIIGLRNYDLRKNVTARQITRTTRQRGSIKKVIHDQRFPCDIMTSNDSLESYQSARSVSPKRKLPVAISESDHGADGDDEADDDDDKLTSRQDSENTNHDNLDSECTHHKTTSESALRKSCAVMKLPTREDLDEIEMPPTANFQPDFRSLGLTDSLGSAAADCDESPETEDDSKIIRVKYIAKDKLSPHAKELRKSDAPQKPSGPPPSGDRKWQTPPSTPPTP